MVKLKAEKHVRETNELMMLEDLNPEQVFNADQTGINLEICGER